MDSYTELAPFRSVTLYTLEALDEIASQLSFLKTKEVREWHHYWIRLLR